MPSRPSHLPDYMSPPVSEVALSVQFSTLRGYKVVHAGLLWEKFRKAFPRCEEKSPLEPAFETFGAKLSQGIQGRIQFLETPPYSRLWFLNRDSTQVVQFQPDRFAHNWRKVGKGTEYPRYETIRKEFISGLRKLRSFAKAEAIGDVLPNLVEISYINVIPSEKGENLPAKIGKVFTFWNNKRYQCDLGQMEMSRFQTKFVIADKDGNPFARLHATAEPVSVNGTPSIQFTLMVRGRPCKATLKAVEEFIDMGRDRIVQAFTEMTTSEMHKLWGRKK